MTPAIPDDYLSPRWSDADLHRIVGVSTLGVLGFGGAWLTWRNGWLLWPAIGSGLALQVAATMLAARAAVEHRPKEHPPEARGTKRTAIVEPASDGILSALGALLASLFSSAPAAEIAPPPEPVEKTTALPVRYTGPSDATLHRAFFRRIVEAEFTEHPAGLVWPDLSAVQGSLGTRLRLFSRQPATQPVPVADVGANERGAGPPWQHLGAIDATAFRRGDVLARLSHRAFAPLAFLELHARLDMESGEREDIEIELLRALTVGYGKILTPPCVLRAASPLRERMGGIEALSLVDDARLALRSASAMSDAERVRLEWMSLARAKRDELAWPGELMSMVESLIDYWFIQRAAAADLDWAEELARLEGTTLGAALAKRDAEGEFQFAAALRLACGGSRSIDAALPAAAPALDQSPTPTAATTVA